GPRERLVMLTSSRPVQPLPRHRRARLPGGRRMSWGGRKAQALLRLVLEEYGPLCHLCLVPIDLELRGHRRGPSVDHLIPRSMGGTDDLENLRPAHRSCNSRRGARLLTPALLTEFRSRRPENGAGFFHAAPRTQIGRAHV